MYEFGKKLGEGSFGVVYECVHRTECSGPSRRVRVCKVISKSRADRIGTSVNKIREEFAVLKMLDHPHVVRIFEDFEDERHFFLVMEPCSGGDLMEAVKYPCTQDAALWERWAAKVMLHILLAMSYCHSRGVIHKDLKPENVMMVSPRGAQIKDVHVVVVDFGLAEMFADPADRGTQIAGTPPFMAPEVWAGNFTQSCDVWSCGVILFYVLSGHFPFLAKRLEDFPKVVSQEPNWQLISGATAEGQYIVWRMLCKTEVGRPSAKELPGDRWFQCQGLAGDESTGGASSAGHPAANVASQHLRGLMKVKQRSQFEKFVARLVATQLDAGQLQRVNEAFRAFDADRDGALSCSELEKGLLMLGAKPEQARQVVEELDVGKTGRVSYTEFLAGVTDLRNRSPQERDKLLWLAWQQFNPDRRGMVRTSDVMDALAARGMTVAELPQAFLRQLRRGTTGEMTFEMFKSLFHGDESCSIMSSFMGNMGGMGRLSTGCS